LINCFIIVKIKIKKKKLSDGVDDTLDKNLKFIPYNDINNSIKIIKKYKKKLCCILVEPIQGGFPSKSGINYLKSLNNYCKKNKIILFFDEILTGVRVNCSSVQNILKINSDISTFGKIIGGGMPIGVIGISKKIVKNIKLNKKKIFFGGTYSGNPLTTLVGNETLNFIIKNKKKIFPKIENHSKLMQTSINTFIEKNNIDAKFIRFHSLARIVFSKENIKDRPQRDFFEKKNTAKRESFIKYLRNAGIYFPGNGVICLSYSLTNNQVFYVIKKLKAALTQFFIIKK